MSKLFELNAQRTQLGHMLQVRGQIVGEFAVNSLSTYCKVLSAEWFIA